MTTTNTHDCVQATPGYALLFVPAQVSGAPDAERSATTRTAMLVVIMTVGWFLAVGAYAGSQEPVRTNSLAFHLQSLRRTPTQQEREAIEQALTLMHKYGCRSDFPLRSIKRDNTKNEWVLLFDSNKPDAGFRLYLRDKNADWFEVDYPMMKGRERFPAEKAKR